MRAPLASLDRRIRARLAALACGLGDAQTCTTSRCASSASASTPNDLPVVLLEERGGSRWLAIWIGSAEAESIAMSIEEIASRGPTRTISRAA
jgi:hypothetical protein